ncbi:hypothetical protein GCM10023196_066230 [Actinoallomurus vinaceus]|uniref:HTH cro/C1-type domain-containing protein n=1 Tax=Actinoallomurus vinaceus TaxID=1080074 RepID=A0ABP8UHS5_9ACTN
MGRPERPLDPMQGPLASFAHDLRALRHKAGTPSYRRLAAEAHFSATALSRAASGDVLPSLGVTLAFVAACGGDTREWETRWHAVHAALKDEIAKPAGAHQGAIAEPPMSAADPDTASSSGAVPDSSAAPAPGSVPGPLTALDPGSASDSSAAPASGSAPGSAWVAALDRVRGRRRLGVAVAVVIGLAGAAGVAAALLPASPTTAHPAPRAIRKASAADSRDTDYKGRLRPVLHEGPVTLRANQVIDFDDPSWPITEASKGNPYDLEFTSQDRSLDSIGSDDITVLPPGSHGTRSECGAQQNYSEPVTPALDRPGTLFCLITDTRRYVLCRTTAVTRDASGRPAEVRLYAVIWEPREAD